jgi:hypothetical protein
LAAAIGRGDWLRRLTAAIGAAVAAVAAIAAVIAVIAAIATEATPAATSSMSLEAKPVRRFEPCDRSTACTAFFLEDSGVHWVLVDDAGVWRNHRNGCTAPSHVS